MVATPPPLEPGLCSTCRNRRQVRSARASTFVLCTLSERDARFPKYPRLPVWQCSGYVEVREKP